MNNHFVGNITYSTIVSFVDSEHFKNSFENIKKVNSNAIKKTDFEHFVSVVFGKLAEIFVAKNIKSIFSEKELNTRIIYSPIENGYEIADLKIVDQENNNNFKLVEVRSSFQANIQENLNHIIRYLNQYKTKETYKDYYFQVFFNEDKNNIYQKLHFIFDKYQKFKKLNTQSNNEKVNFKSFLSNQYNFNEENLNSKLCNIINYSFISKQEIQENRNNQIQTKHLKQFNTSFEAKLLKHCLGARQGIDFICEDFKRFEDLKYTNSFNLKKT